MAFKGNGNMVALFQKRGLYMLRYLTAGESHGKSLSVILDGMAAGLDLPADFINKELARRQTGYGRGGRMAIEKDAVEITSGVRFGKTLGSPIAMLFKNKDWENWKEVMDAGLGVKGQRLIEEVTRPRPGHADLSGVLKYGHTDIRNVLERSSARETAARVGVGAVCKRFLEEFGIKVISWVIGIGGSQISLKFKSPVKTFGDRFQISKLEEIFLKAEDSDVRCPDKKSADRMRKAIDTARKNGNSLGGVFEVVVTGAPPGLGSHVQWDRKLDARLAFALMGIQAIKGVEVGMGFDAAQRFGSEVHDEIFYKQGQGVRCQGSGETWPIEPRFFRKTNNAGGIEGGMSNGEPIVLRAAMKPIPTLYKPLRSIDIKTKKPFEASVERSDICAVPAASVIGEAVTAFEIANAFLEKFGGDSLKETMRNYQGYLGQLKRF